MGFQGHWRRAGDCLCGDIVSCVVVFVATVEMQVFILCTVACVVCVPTVATVAVVWRGASAEQFVATDFFEHVGVKTKGAGGCAHGLGCVIGCVHNKQRGANHSEGNQQHKAANICHTGPAAACRHAMRMDKARGSTPRFVGAFRTIV